MSKQIPLSRGQFALVDDEDYAWLNQYKWTWQPPTKNRQTGYAYRREYPSNKSILMHRLILDAPKGMQVDHINGDGLDNQRQNLRLATNRQNHFNLPKRQDGETSNYKGVYLAPSGYGWVAQIRADEQHIHLGTFPTQREAAIAYNAAALQYHGEFARLNDIPPEPSPDDQPIYPPPQTSHYLGVSWDKRRQSWRAYFKLNGRQHFVGYYETEESAAHARDAAIRLYLGRRIKLNFPDE